MPCAVALLSAASSKVLPMVTQSLLLSKTGNTNKLNITGKAGSPVYSAGTRLYGMISGANTPSGTVLSPILPKNIPNANNSMFSKTDLLFEIIIKKVTPRKIII